MKWFFITKIFISKLMNKKIWIQMKVYEIVVKQVQMVMTNVEVLVQSNWQMKLEGLYMKITQLLVEKIELCFELNLYNQMVESTKQELDDIYEVKFAEKI